MRMEGAMSRRRRAGGHRRIRVMLELAIGVVVSGLLAGALVSRGTAAAEPLFRPAAGGADEEALRIEAVSDAELSELRGRAPAPKPAPTGTSKRRVILWDEAMRPPDPALPIPATVADGNHISIRRPY